METTGALGGGLLDVSVPDVRGPDNGAFSDICHTAKISSCLQEITEVGIPIVNASRDDLESCTPNTKKDCKLQISKKIGCVYEEMFKQRAMRTGILL